MNLFGSVVGALAGAAGGPSGGPSDLSGLLGTLLSQGGGLPALIEKFQQGGLGHVVASWVGSGENLPISAAQVQQVLGSEFVVGLARQFGLDSQALAEQLSTLLPQVVDRMTPDGRMPAPGAGGAELGDLAGLLGGLLKR